MLQFITSVIIAVAMESGTHEVSAEEKREFLKLLSTLPHEGEFFTKKAVEKAAPYTPVLLSLTAEDLRGYDLYPFLALSRGLLDSKDQRVFGVEHFDAIAHAQIKLAWGVVLFNKKAASSEVVKFLRSTLASDEGKSTLKKCLGPDFDDFQKRLSHTKVETEKGKD